VFKKKRLAKQERKAAQVAVANVVSCFCSHPDEIEVRSSVVLHDGEDPAQPFGIVNLGFSDDDRPAIYMDGDLTALVYEVHRAPSVTSAEAMALEWIASAEKMDFRYLPGVYQAAYVEFVTGIPQEPHESHFAWALPPVNGMHPFCRFPPDVNKDAKESRGFVLMPEHAVDALYESRGW
jgi:hypothetical protein